MNYGLLETLGMQMVAGRTFSSAISSDSSEIIFNEAGIKAMGIKDPIGKTVTMWGQDRRAMRLLMLSADFSKPILVAVLIAFPLA